MSRTAYLITIGEPDIDGVMADEFEEALIYVGRMIEKLSDNDEYIGKYIYVVEYLLSINGYYVKQDGLFFNRYLIEK
jgi:hypothetical protein